ncbi:helix-turn-helix domain-containing protein [Microbacterium esteraromaticum]|uniref:PucR family transcriptional regulator n=1 Tax=Microbacterium esteraromaticum TaxID=57043 RepID=UPI0030AFBD87
MSLDLRAIVRAVGGECLEHGVSARTPVDGVAALDGYVVASSSDFVTLLIGPPAQLRARLAAGGDVAEVTTRAVYISSADDDELRAMTAQHSMTAILGATRIGPAWSAVGADTAAGPAIVDAALHARLSALIAEDQAAADRIVTTGTKVLTQVARRGGVTAVIAELAHRIDGWAVLLDPHGQLIASAGAGRLHVDDAVAAALGRPVRVRHPGIQVHQVGSDRDLSGYLVIATRSRVISRSRDLASQSAALFDLLLRTRDPSLTEHLGREALIGVLLEGGPAATALLRRWGVRESGLTAFQFGTRTRTIDPEPLVARWFDELSIEHIFVGEPGRVRGFLPDHLSEELAARVTAFTPLGSGTAHLGLGLPAPAELLRRSAIQAQQALDSAIEDGHKVLRYTELPTVDLVLGALGGDGSAHLSAALDDLRDARGEHGALTETLRVFLAENGAQAASAARLGIHRQTLISRIHRIEHLTGLSMERADDRAAAWLALRALGITLRP